MKAWEMVEGKIYKTTLCGFSDVFYSVKGCSLKTSRNTTYWAALDRNFNEVAAMEFVEHVELLTFERIKKDGIRKIISDNGRIHHVVGFNPISGCLVLVDKHGTTLWNISEAWLRNCNQEA
jgi:hypothetical protein